MTLILLTVAGLLTAGTLTLFLPRWYQSTATIEVQTTNDGFLAFRDSSPFVTPGNESFPSSVETQAEIMRQDSIIDLAVTRHGIDRRSELILHGQSMSDLFQSDAKSRDAIHRRIVEMIKAHLTIVPVRNTRIIEIISELPEPQLASEVANAIAECFIESTIHDRQRAAQEAYAFLTLELVASKHKLLQSELQMLSYGAQTAVARPPRVTTLLPTRAGIAVYSTLKSQLDADRQFYQALMQRANAAEVASGLRQSNIRLIDKARPPNAPYRPNLPLNLTIGALGTLLLASGWIIIKEQTNQIMRTPGEVSRYLTVPELGAIPRVAGASVGSFARLLTSANSPSKPARTPFEHRLSSLSESFRFTLASILSASANGGSSFTMVVTSSQSMEGKTTVVSNLGVALSEISQKVLLIDGDMRRPQLHRLFDQSNSWGLTDVLRENNAIEDLPVEALARKTTWPHLYLLPSGPYSDNIFGLLYAGRFAQLLPRFRREFEYVLIDAPPCLEFADARLMARHAANLLLVVRANYTARKTVERAIQSFMVDRLSVMGVILNNWKSEHFGFRVKL